MTSDANTFIASNEGADESKRPFVFGNPYIEKKIGGVLHFYKKIDHENKIPHNCSVLCMIGVPAFFTCRELINFVALMADAIFQMRIIRDDSPNQYMVILKFKSRDLAVSFFEQYNDVEFNSIERERCSLLFVERLEMDSKGADDFEAVTFDSSPSSSSTLMPVPNCSVCLEKMDDGLMTILCNHTFHAECLRKWADTTCPVCRDSQTPELVPTQSCKDCGIATDLWMCLICGNIGCGRYTNAHAYKHFEVTSHIFTLQVGGKMVWDYASDTYVHRLIQDSTNGKMVEYTGEDESRWEKDSEKLDSIQMEYSFYLTSQLESQRLFFEDKFKEAELQRMKAEKNARVKISSLEAGLEAKTLDCVSLNSQLESQRFLLEEARLKISSLESSLGIKNSELEKANMVKVQAERRNTQLQAKLAKAQNDLSAERQMNEMLRKDKDLLKRQRDEAEELRKKDIARYEEQIHDFMLHFDTQAKIQGALKEKDISTQELQDSEMQVKLNESPSSSNRKKRASRKS